MAFRAVGTVVAVGFILPGELREVQNDIIEAKMTQALEAVEAAERLTGKEPGARTAAPHYAVLLLDCDESTVRARGALFKRELEVRMVPK